ncbi:MAG: hypothetical protein ACJ0GO_01770 [Gammaproteobacteria bacterium]|uniref:Uncharacterized protein n=1 Tax=SAR86 cluster bacterium TaxID=2030880 RepID=A0A520MTQ7_9GAMM|nr:MAG: hypothetical protein EVA99_01260 [SAR86 cluster bacterium]
MKTVVGFVNGLTGVLVAVLGLGIVAQIVIGDAWFAGDVIGNIMMYVDMLGENGLAGLVVLLIIMGVLNIK